MLFLSLATKLLVKATLGNLFKCSELFLNAFEIVVGRMGSVVITLNIQMSPRAVIPLALWEACCSSSEEAWKEARKHLHVRKASCIRT